MTIEEQQKVVDVIHKMADHLSGACGLVETLGELVLFSPDLPPEVELEVLVELEKAKAVAAATVKIHVLADQLTREDLI